MWPNLPTSPNTSTQAWRLQRMFLSLRLSRARPSLIRTLGTIVGFSPHASLLKPLGAPAASVQEVSCSNPHKVSSVHEFFLHSRRIHCRPIARWPPAQIMCAGGQRRVAAMSVRRAPRSLSRILETPSAHVGGVAAPRLENQWRVSFGPPLFEAHRGEGSEVRRDAAPKDDPKVALRYWMKFGAVGANVREEVDLGAPRSPKSASS